MGKSKLVIGSILFCFFFSEAWGQKANYREAERFARGGDASRALKWQNVHLEPIENSGRFWFRHFTGDAIRYYLVDPKARKKTELFDLSYMAQEIERVISRPIDEKNLDINIRFLNKGKALRFTIDTFRLEYDLKTKKLTGEKWDPMTEYGNIPVTKTREIGKRKAKGYQSPYKVYSRGYNLWVLDTRDSTERRLTSDGSAHYPYVSTFVVDTTRREEYFPRWFEGSDCFCVTRRVEAGDIQKYALVTDLYDSPIAREYNYERAGMNKVDRYEMVIFNARTGQRVEVPVDKWSGQAIAALGMRLNGRYFYFTRERRTHDELELCRVDSTGAVTVVINEVCKPYFNVELNATPHWFLDDGNEILWWSERTGHGHYYLYDRDGNLKHAVTSGDWTAGKYVSLDEKKRVLYFESYGQIPGENPYYKRLSKVSLDGGDVKILTPEMATHDVLLMEEYLWDSFSRADLEPRSVLRDLEGNLIVELARADLSTLYATGWKMPEPFTVKAADGKTDLYGVMWKPYDFDSTRRYPIISYVYPGPQTEELALEFFGDVNMKNAALAQVGFIVVGFGHRGGSPVRDAKYHTYGYGNLRDYALEDDKCGLEQLIERYPFIDGSRVGIYGHSGGGFMSTAAICTYPDFYKAAVASSGNHDNRIYNRRFVETHHGINEVRKEVRRRVKSASGKDSLVMENKTVFELNVPVNADLAGNLKGHLMLVTGSADDNVHPAHTYRMAAALLKAGKNFELVVLPGAEHNYFGDQWTYYERKMWFHFGKYLLGDYSSEGQSDIKFYMNLK
ncbi:MULTISPECIES: S9 family peptidase [Butyricimonas]|uniref:S9 family peptidase n=1 Tax=Butyricimonas TaxID=574697 RepID=UPI0007FB41DD|nr:MULTISPECIES: prolyl oligopeptidase family serine peptidase [Butyricimonas]